MNYKILKRNCKSNTFCMVRNSIIVLLFAFSHFIMTGCKHDPNDDPEPDCLVEVSFTAKPLSGSLLKSAANPSEDLIGKIILFGVNEQNEVVQTFPVLLNPPLFGKTLVISRKVKSLYAIANPTPAMEAATLSSVSDLISMIGNFTNAPQSPFLMSGKSNVSGNSVNIELIRTVAKIDIIGKNGFLITTVTVMNTAAKGYVFNRETLSIPTSGITTYSYSGNSPSIYIAENSKLNPVQFVVTGQFQGKQESHTFTLTSGGQNIDIVRNTSYLVSIYFEE